MIQKSVLDNGIRLITEKIPTAHSVTVGIWVENGSRHEMSEQGGISHFIEHMLFKGTERRNALAIAKEIDSVGGILNGFTSREFSCYYAKVLAERLPLAVDLLTDLVLNSRFDPDEIEKERRVILQEISTEDDTPDDLVHDLFNRHFWGGHPLGQSILGSRESVGAIDRQEMLDYLAEHYCGERLIVCAAGCVDHQRLVDQVNERCAAIQRCGPSGVGPVPLYHRSFQQLDKDLEQVQLCLGTRFLPQNHPNRFTAFLLNTILGGGMSSRLFQRIREEEGLAYSIYSYLNCHSDAGALVIYAAAAPAAARQVLELILDEMARLGREAISGEELHCAKEQLRGNLLLSQESTDNCMTRLAKNEIYLGRNPPLKETLGGIARVTADDVQRLAAFVMQEPYLNLQLLGRPSSGITEADLTFNR